MNLFIIIIFFLIYKKRFISVGTIYLGFRLFLDCFSLVDRVSGFLPSFYRVYQVWIWFYRVLPSFTVFYRVLLGFTEFYWV